jgi:hypothetical protein
MNRNLVGSGEDILEIARKNNFLWWLCLLTDQDEMTNLYIGPTTQALVARTIPFF